MMIAGFDLPHDAKLSDFDNHFRLLLRKHWAVFVFWSILNCVGGSIGVLILRGSTYYFWMMSGVWGIINFAFAIAFFYHTLYRKRRKESFHERLVVQNHVERMMFLNSVIDVVYVFVGFELREHSFISDVSYPDLWLGFGWAIALQGLFLLAQDMTFLYLYRHNFRKA
jgi:hypothetical protein